MVPHAGRRLEAAARCGVALCRHHLRHPDRLVNSKGVWNATYQHDHIATKAGVTQRKGEAAQHSARLQCLDRYRHNKSEVPGAL